MTRESASPSWPSVAPPSTSDGWTWGLTHVSELPRVRSGLRRHLVDALRGAGSRTTATLDDAAAELVDRVVLAFDEMASNALRHGGTGATATVSPHEDCWLVEVRDAAGGRPPTPAIGRDPSLGGLGLYLIAEMAVAHGWHTESSTKVVWALLPR